MIGGIIGALLGASGARGQVAPTIVVRSIGAIFFVLTAALTITRVSEGRLGAAALLALVAFLLFTVIVPELAAPFVFEPLGMVRYAWLVERLSGGCLEEKERRCSGELFAARVLAVRPSERGARFVEARLARHRELTPGGVAAHALVAASRGRHDEARALFRALTRLEMVSFAVSRLAWDYLHVDAIERGALGELTALPAAAAGRRGRFAMALVAREQAAPSFGSRWQLFDYWLAAPLRRRTFHYLRDTWDAAPAEAVPPPEGPLATFLALLAAPPDTIDEEALATAGAEIDALTSAPVIAADLSRRALALGIVADTSEVQGRMARELERDLAQVIVTSDVDLDLDAIESPALGRAAAVARSENVSRLELLARELDKRRAAREDLSEADEWRSFGELARAIARARRHDVPGHAAVVHAAVYVPVVNWAVRLMNTRDLRLLTRHVFLELGRLAHAAKDKPASGLLARNASACLADRLPRQVPLAGELRTDPKAVERARRITPWVAVGSLALGVLGAAVLLEMQRDDLLPLLVAPFAGFVGTFVARARLVEVATTADGVVVQTEAGRAYFRPRDVSELRLGNVLVLRLRRRPRWLPATVLTIAARADAG